MTTPLPPDVDERRKDGRKKPNPKTRSTLSMEYQERKMIKSVSFGLSLVNPRHKAVYDRLQVTKDKKKVFIEAMENYFKILDEKK